MYHWVIVCIKYRKACSRCREDVGEAVILYVEERSAIIQVVIVEKTTI